MFEVNSLNTRATTLKSIHSEGNSLFISNFEHKVKFLTINEIWKSESIHHSEPNVKVI